MIKSMLWIGVVIVGYLLFAPVSIDPLAWTPPQPNPAFAAENEQLHAIEWLARGNGQGPEGIAVDAQGRLYAGYDDGRVMRLDAHGAHAELLANTGGRPLGITVLGDDSIVVADALKGLLRIDSQRTLHTLATEADGLPLGFTDDADHHGNIVYFSDASSRHGIHQLMPEVFESRAHGRLLAHDLAAGTTTTLLDDLYFANGVAVGPDGAYVLVNETTRYRVRRYWLTGARAGQSDVFIDNLPGMPDNISFNGQDRFWLALYAPRPAALDALLPHPWLRKIVFRLPAALHPAPAHKARVLAVDLNGQVRADWQDNRPSAYAPITSAVQFEKTLYFGSLSAPAIGRLPLPAQD